MGPALSTINYGLAFLIVPSHVRLTLTLHDLGRRASFTFCQD